MWCVTDISRKKKIIQRLFDHGVHLPIAFLALLLFHNYIILFERKVISF